MKQTAELLGFTYHQILDYIDQTKKELVLDGIRIPLIKKKKWFVKRIDLAVLEAATVAPVPVRLPAWDEPLLDQKPRGRGRPRKVV